ncbi:hypothetical protein [Arenibaculum pallidiluteum]|uniref:hypothetical protein n=1 Tax=Arenibaculum pallidiluteum TaxID=2812559 RepID=UPI001A978CB2|nr:hypothetical protein [Arenibaculum pallidiluteum]
MLDDEKRAWVERVLGYHLDASGQHFAQDVAAAQKAWQAACASALAQLRGLRAAIASAEDPEGPQAIVQLEEIMDALSPVLGTRQEVEGLERYLATDAIVEDAENPNGFGTPVSIRDRLLPVLHTLRQAMPQD